MKSLIALTTILVMTLLTHSAKVSAQACQGWEVDISQQNVSNPRRTVTVHPRDPRVFCSAEAEERGECEVAPEGIFHILALVECPPAADAEEFDKAVDKPNEQYALKLLSLCTAVRISEHWALSAAHCIVDSNGAPRFPDELALALDFELQDSRHLAVLPIESIALSSDDLALFRFDSSTAPTLEGISPAEMQITEIYDQKALSEEKQHFIDDGSIEIGSDWPPAAKIWGYGETNVAIEETSGLLGRLIEARIALDNTSLPSSEKERLLRADSADVDAPKLCSGDSGGPWFIQDTMLIGLSTKSSATCNANSSNIADALRIAPFCDWLESTTCSAGEAVCCVRSRNEEPANRKTPNGCMCSNQ